MGCCSGQSWPRIARPVYATNLARRTFGLARWLCCLLLVRVLLPEPPFVGVRALVDHSRIFFATAGSTKVDRLVGLVFCRLQRRRSLCSRWGRRRRLGGLTLQALQILGICRRRGVGPSSLSNRRGLFRGLFRG